MTVSGVLKGICRIAGAVLIVGIAAVIVLFWDSDAAGMKFAVAENEDELVSALIENFDTGYESVVIWTKGFKIDRENIASYIAAEISNDPEDICIMPASYTVEIYTFFHLLKFRLCFSDAEDDASADSADSSGGHISYTEEEITEARAEVSDALDDIVDAIIAENPETQEEWYYSIFVYLCDNVEYDYELSDAITGGDMANPLRKNRGIYGALIAGKTVCSGYAAAYKAICDRLGLECWVAESEDHAWNLILVDGKVCCVDATSGDQDTWIAKQFFMTDPSEYETQYGYTASESCYIPEQFAFN